MTTASSDRPVGSVDPKLLDFAPVHSLQHRLSSRKVPIQGTNADARATRNLFERDARTDFREGGFRGINEQQPIAGSVRARFARLCGGLRFCVDRTAPQIKLAKRRLPPYINRRFPPLAIKPLFKGAAIGQAPSARF